MKKFLIILICLIVSMPCCYAKSHKEKELQQQQIRQYLNLEWWANYQDDILLEHLRALSQSNYDLKNANLKVKENEKLVRMQLAVELPAIGFDGGIGREFRSSVKKYGSLAIASYAQNNFQFPLTASYEIDIWGKNRLKTKSAKQGLEMIKQAQRATYICLSSDFASDYYNLIKADKLLEIQTELVEIQKEIVSKTKDEYDIGLCSKDAVLVEEKMLSRLSEEKNILKNKQQVLENVLKAYLALTEGDVKRSKYSQVVLIENIPEEFNTDIIYSRPDYLQQEANVKRVGYDVKVARRELLPSFVIYGQIGLNAYRFSDLFKTSTQLANAGILPTFDIFTGGRKMAFLKLQKYRYDQALNDYQKTMVEDIKEVNTAVCELKTAKNNLKEATERLDIQNRLYYLVYTKEQIGSASELEVLYAKQNDLIVEKDKVSNAINYIISTISLYKSVGGKNLFELKPQKL